jgi:hypothetical protein
LVTGIQYLGWGEGEDPAFCCCCLSCWWWWLGVWLVGEEVLAGWLAAGMITHRLDCCFCVFRQARAD